MSPDDAGQQIRAGQGHHCICTYTHHMKAGLLAQPHCWIDWHFPITAQARMQSLTSRASQSVASSRIAARQSSRARPVAVSSSSRSQHRLTRYVAVKAAEVGGTDSLKRDFCARRLFSLDVQEATATAEPVTEASTSDGEANGR
jgi:hypothetical protein